MELTARMQRLQEIAEANGFTVQTEPGADRVHMFIMRGNSLEMTISCYKSEYTKRISTFAVSVSGRKIPLHQLATRLQS
jgi:hypothetical protein